MLEYQKVKLLEKHARNVLKLEPFLLRISGYNPEETRLSIDKHLLHCTPASLSLTNCRLLVFLGKNEIEHFTQFKNKLVSLNLAFDSTYFGSSVSFYIKGKMNTLDELRENVYSLEFSLSAVPETYKELFLYLSEISAIYRKIYDTKITPEQQAGIKKFPIVNSQIFKDDQLLCNAKINNLSARHIELDVLQDSYQMSIGETYKYTILFNGSEIKLSGKPVKSRDNLYISSLDFNLEYIHVISKFMQLNQQKDGTEVQEDLEEI